MVPMPQKRTNGSDTMQYNLTDLSRKKFETYFFIGFDATDDDDVRADFDVFASSNSKMSAIFFGRNKFEAEG